MHPEGKKYTMSSGPIQNTSSVKKGSTGHNRKDSMGNHIGLGPTLSSLLASGSKEMPQSAALSSLTAS